MEPLPHHRTISREYAKKLARHVWPIMLLLRGAMFISIMQIVPALMAGQILLFPIIACVLAWFLEWATADMLKRAGIDENTRVEGMRLRELGRRNSDIS